jgi:16S rRNA (guanine(966)-N(2))-methyltransferase RsmD
MSLRIQSGSARGRSLKALPTGPDVRPILARIRKSLFDILRPKLAGVRFLDLFAGTGTVGIEALSNGASSAVFVDASPNSCRLIEKNLTALGFADRARVVRANATQSLSFLGGDPFQLVFMGPPYKDEKLKPLALTIPALRALVESHCLAPGAWVVGQHHKKEPLAGVPAGWTIFRENKYGDSVLTFFREGSDDEK